MKVKVLAKCWQFVRMETSDSPTNQYTTTNLDRDDYVPCTHPQFLEPNRRVLRRGASKGNGTAAPVSDAYRMLRDVNELGQRRPEEVIAHMVQTFQEVDQSHLQIERHQWLGKGATGRVDLCTCRSPQGADLVALKELANPERCSLKNPNLQQVLEALPFEEAAIQALVVHTNIVEIYWADVSVVDMATNKAIPLVLKAQAGGGRAAPLTDVSVSGSAPTPVLTLVMLMEGGERLAQYVLPDVVGLNLRIAMEYCNYGALSHHLQSRNATKETVPINVMVGSMDSTFCAALTALDVVRGLRLLHINNVIHGDVKPHNILLSATPPSREDPRGFIAKLSDFGMSVMISGADDVAEVKQGSVEYMPHDAFQNRSVSKYTDVYALGVVMWEIWHNELWEERYRAELNQQRFGNIDMRNFKPQCNSWCPAGYADIVNTCVQSRSGDVTSRTVLRMLETYCATLAEQFQ